MSVCILPSCLASAAQLCSFVFLVQKEFASFPHLAGEIYCCNVVSSSEKLGRSSSDLGPAGKEVFGQLNASDYSLQ